MCSDCLMRSLRFRAFWGVTLLCVGLLTSSTQAQPPDAAPLPSQEMQREVADTVKALVEATGSDDGYKKAEQLVEGAWLDGRMARVWQEWRRMALTSNFAFAETSPTQIRLLFHSAEIEEWSPGRGVGRGSVAQVKVHLDVATVSPTLPITQWPVEPWQGEFTLQKADAPDAAWKFALPHTTRTPDVFFQMPERGGDHLTQAVEVLRAPDALLRTVRAQAQERALRQLVSATRLYIEQRGHYPPARYFAALVESVPPAERSQLRAAFRVANTTRRWTLNPALAGRVAQRGSLSPRTPLFWDGSASRPYFTLGGFAVVAFVDGRVERTSPQIFQLRSGSRASRP